MRKSNNKGFSLIEVVIAVAVFTLLIVPIVIQLTKALNTNAAAKERQAAVENADMALEYFQKTDMKTLQKGGSENYTFNAASDVNTFPSVNCELYTSGSGGSLSKVADIKYKVTDYTLSDVQLGRKKNTYTQKVMIDDLNNKVMEADYRISTSSTASGDGWVKTNENNLVKYDSDGHVCAVVVEKREKGGIAEPAYQDPNKVNLGFVENVESDTMAVIPGDQTQVDVQFNADVYNTVISAALETKDTIINDPSAGEEVWNTIVGQMNGYDGSVLDYNARRVGTTTARVLLATVRYFGPEDGVVDEYYEVNVDAYYSTVIDPLTVQVLEKPLTNSITEVYKYPIYNQRFYTTSPPDIYLVYEPLLRKSTDMTSYVTDDYIVTALDEKVMNHPDGPSKLRLIKSNKTSLNGAYTDGNKFLSGFNYPTSEVKIHLVGLSETDDADKKPMDVYTNVAATHKNDDPNAGYEITEENKEAQFASETFSQTDTSKDPAETKNCWIPITIEKNSEFKKVTDEFKYWVPYSLEDNIKPITGGERTDDRLHTVRVVLSNNETNEKIYLTGAKGAD